MNNETKEVITINPTAIQRAAPSATSAVELSRAVQEVQGALMIARMNPRDEIRARDRIMKSCQREALAKDALYAFPRGGEMVTGPSIRLAEVLAQNWGNVDCGIRELSQNEKESEMMAHCWDLETNYRQTKVFTVPHKRFTKRGETVLKDPRDIYENNTNNGSRRLRACILAVIPPDVIEEAVEQCRKTLEKGGSEPIVDRIRKMVGAFFEIGITRELLEKRLGKTIDQTTPPELVELTSIFKTIRDGMSKKEDFFDLPSSQVGGAADLNAKFAVKNSHKVEATQAESTVVKS